MPTYYMNEGAFDLLDATFVDRTVHVFGARLPSGEDLGFTVMRRKIPEGKSLRDMARENLARDAEGLLGHAVIEQRDTEVAGAPGIDVRARWRHEGRVYYQRQVHLAALDTWLFFAMTAPLAERALCDEQLGNILDSLRLRDPE